MRKVFGVVFMLLGVVLIAGAALLFCSNRQEDQEAGEFSDVMLIQIQEQIQQERAKDVTEAYTEAYLDNVPIEFLEAEDLVMTEKEVNGYACIGYIEIPDLNLQLPVISDWSYPKLKISPCRFYGTARGEDLVIMAHNYKTHFGKISTLAEGAAVRLTDMDGKVWDYQVVAKDILDPYDMEDMIAGEYDLTLFSCTPGGKQRVTIRCDRIET